MAASGYALAEEVVDGVLDRIDQEERTVTLADGQVFVLAEINEYADIQPGEKVTITYEEQNGENVIQSILPGEPNE
jgi:hypothetical protein